MRRMGGKIFNILLVLLVLYGGYYYRDEIGQLTENRLAFWKPCRKPISYSLQTFDRRFGITEEEFLGVVLEAENIWEALLEKNLFEYKEGSELSINLIYDQRQRATDKLKELNIVIGEDKEAYDRLKARYTSLSASYKSDRTLLEKMIAEYETRRSAYEKEIVYWNSRGGAPIEKYNELEKERGVLNKEASTINQAQNTLSGGMEIINALGAEVNKLARNLNLQVETFNDIGGNGEEFDEGEYADNGAGKMINVYQFDSWSKLLRVLAHELGHARGLPHVEDPASIMYRLNQSTNEKLTASDMAALKKLCGFD